MSFIAAFAFHGCQSNESNGNMTTASNWPPNRLQIGSNYEHKLAPHTSKAPQVQNSIQVP